MIKSLRVRLLVWYAVVLTAVVAGFAGVLYYRVRTARLSEIDASLAATASYLDAALRSFPVYELDAGRPEPPWRDDHDGDGRRRGRGGRMEGKGPGPKGDGKGPGPKGEGKGPRPGAPPFRTREQLMAELTPPTAQPVSPDYFAVWRADGSPIKTFALPPDASPPATDDLPPFRPEFSNHGDRREVRQTGPRSSQIVVGRSVGKELADLRAFGWQLAGAGVAALLVGLAGGWVIAARIVRPIAAMSATAAAVSATRLGERIDVRGVDTEMAGLAGTLNAMLDRLQAAFDRQTQFTADASHELRTPLAVIRSHAELALARPRSDDDYRQALGACLRSAGRMSGIVERLLTLARADAGFPDLKHESVDLGAVAAETAALFRPLAEEQGVRMKASGSPVTVVGDRSALAQVVTNLVGNAVQYNRPGGKVTVRLAADGGDAVLTVADTGVGIPTADLPHIFERFYRVNKARSRALGGTGLGLAICRSIVEAHHGTIAVASTPDAGTTFTVRVPLSPGG